MPIGAFIASKKLMDHFKQNPILGHITTFGGHPVSCAASLACIEVIDNEGLVGQVTQKERLFTSLLSHSNIDAVRGKGLMLAVQLDSFDNVQKVITHCLEQGVISDWFLFCDNAIRLSPPLNISEDEIKFASSTLLEGIHNL